MHAVIDTISGEAVAICATLDRAYALAIGEQHVVVMDRGAQALVAHIPPDPGLGGWARAWDREARRWAQERADRWVWEVVREFRWMAEQDGYSMPM